MRVRRAAEAVTARAGSATSCIVRSRRMALALRRAVGDRACFHRWPRADLGEHRPDAAKRPTIRSNWLLAKMVIRLA